MEPKKNPKYDVHQHRAVLLNVGLIISLVLVIAAFKWTAPLRERTVLPAHDPFSDMAHIDQPTATDFSSKAPVTKPMQTTVPIAANIVEVTSLLAPENPDAPPIELECENHPVAVGTIDIPVETPEPDTFRVVEKMPEPVVGWKVFYETLQKH